jgi:hypothetical protein
MWSCSYNQIMLSKFLLLVLWLLKCLPEQCVQWVSKLDHEWNIKCGGAWTRLDLNTSLENSNFKIVDSSTMLHYHCLETSFYVFIIHVTFQQTINNVQRQCFKIIVKVNDELEKQFPTQNVMNVLR